MKKPDMNMIQEQIRIFERPAASLSNEMFNYINYLESENKELRDEFKELLNNSAEHIIMLEDEKNKLKIIALEILQKYYNSETMYINSFYKNHQSRFDNMQYLDKELFDFKQKIEDTFYGR